MKPYFQDSHITIYNADCRSMDELQKSWLSRAYIVNRCRQQVFDLQSTILRNRPEEGMEKQTRMPRPYNININHEVISASLAYKKAQKLVEQCTDNCDRCPVKVKCCTLWNEYACNITTGKCEYTFGAFQKRFKKIKAEKRALLKPAEGRRQMAKIATLIYYCVKCDSYFGSNGNLCPVCGNELETKAIINLNELGRVMQELQTPQGIINLLESFKSWVEQQWIGVSQ